MRCNSPGYRSTAEFYNASSQTLTSTATALALLGTEVTDTGVAVDANSNGIGVNYTGTYEAEFDAVVSATTAGLVTLQIYLDGVALPETARTVTASVGNTAISTGTIRSITSPCGSAPNIQLYASTDGTAVGSVMLVSGRIKKL